MVIECVMFSTFKDMRRGIIYTAVAFIIIRHTIQQILITRLTSMTTRRNYIRGIMDNSRERTGDIYALQHIDTL